MSFEFEKTLQNYALAAKECCHGVFMGTAGAIAGTIEVTAFLGTTLIPAIGIHASLGYYSHDCSNAYLKKRLQHYNHPDMKKFLKTLDPIYNLSLTEVAIRLLATVGLWYVSKNVTESIRPFRIQAFNRSTESFYKAYQRL